MTIASRAVGVLVLLAALPTRAAPIDDAKKAFGEGKAAFERGDYESALSAYQRANMILPAPNLYYNIGATYEHLGRYQEAALAFDKYFQMAGTPSNEEEKEFQDKLRTRAESDRHRADERRAPAPPTSPTPPPQQPPPAYYQQPYYGQPYYMTPYYQARPMVTRDMKLHTAQRHRKNAIALMAVGVTLSVIGIGVAAAATAIDTSLTGNAGLSSRQTTAYASEVGVIFVGVSLGIIGVTLWAPGAASFVRSNNEIRELSRPEPVAPSPRGF